MTKYAEQGKIGICLGIGLSFFTNFSLVPMFVACGLISLGVSSYYNQDEQIGKNKKIKAEIEHLENKRMELLQYDKNWQLI